MEIWSKARKKAHKTEDGRVHVSLFCFGVHLQELNLFQNLKPSSEHILFKHFRLILTST